jgi:hypothetical protein
MKKLLALFTAVAMLALTTPAFALFTNGGFEDGTFSGWTLTGDGATLSQVISASSPNQTYQTVDINPYNGTYMARLQNYYGYYHDTTISQTATVSAADKATGDKLYVNWGAVLQEPTNLIHTTAQMPYFDINIFKGATNVGTFHADAGTQQGGGWSLIGSGSAPNTGDYWYKSGTFVFDFADFAIGDLMTIQMSVHDCSLGGHGAYAFLDGIGTTYQPPTVPEPSTLFLLGAGLGGLAIWRRKIRG